MPFSTSTGTLSCEPPFLQTTQYHLRTSLMLVHLLSPSVQRRLATYGTGYGFNADPWCNQTFTPKLLLLPATRRISLTYLYGTFFSLAHPHISSLGSRSYAFPKSINTILMSFCPSLCVSICFGLRRKGASVVPLPVINPNWLSCMFVHSLVLLFAILSYVRYEFDASVVLDLSSTVS